MTAENAPSSAVSPQGRRVLVAIVTGDPGDRIQRWRLDHDPAQAHRIPPHTTLCYWVPGISMADLGAQVQHAFSRPATAWLGGVREFANDQHTFYVEVSRHSAVDEARTRLYDRTHTELPGHAEWTWHVTCVRDSRERDLPALRAAATRLTLECEWPVEKVACLELRADRYVVLEEWQVG